MQYSCIIAYQWSPFEWILLHASQIIILMTVVVESKVSLKWVDCITIPDVCVLLLLFAQLKSNMFLWSSTNAYVPSILYGIPLTWIQ